MGLFKRPVEETRANFNEISKITEFITNSSTGVSITEENVMQIPSVKNAIDMITGTVGSLPINLYEEVNGKIKKLNEDERLFILNNEPNSFETANKLKKDLAKDLLLYGKGYSYLEKKGVKTKGLHFVKANHVQFTDVVNKQGLIIDKKYNFVLNNTSKQESYINVLEVNYGKGALNEGKTLLETLIHQNQYNDYIFKNAILPNGVLETEGRLTKEGAQGLKAQLERMYSGVNNFFRPMVLEQGLKWKTISQKPNDLMLDKAFAQSNSDVEKLFNLPSGMLMMKTSTVGSKPTEDNLLYLQRTITPILIAIEESLNKSLLLESEKKKGYFFRFDTSELFKSTLSEMIELATKGVQGGIFTVNEARFILDKEDVEGGDEIHLNLGGTGENLGEESQDKKESKEAQEVDNIEPTE